MPGSLGFLQSCKATWGLLEVAASTYLLAQPVCSPAPLSLLLLILIQNGEEEGTKLSSSKISTEFYA